MTVKLIAENILDTDMFSSATEEDGEHIGQPEPDSSNEGNLRLLTTGDIQDFTYSGTATGDGSTTTIVDSSLCVYGDDYFIGATITFTDSGNSPVGNTSGSKTITDFAQATGTLTWSGALNSTIAGDTFTLTLSFATRDFEVELINGGDVGDADFKWSHDGGTTYLGRDDPYQADWLALATIVETVANYDENLPRMIEADNGDLVMTYSANGGLGAASAVISSDKGITWGSPISINASSYNMDLTKQKNGRLLSVVRNVETDHIIFYSDDNGNTWNELKNLANLGTFVAILELHNGSIMVAYDTGSEIHCKLSYDGGLNFGSAIEIAADDNSQLGPALTQAENGNIVCVYYSSEDASPAQYEIKGAYSTDNGATWTSEVDVISTAVKECPHVIKDIDGTLYAIGTDRANDLIKMSKSTNHGVTWTHSAAITIKTDTTNDPRNAALCLKSDGDMICVYHGDASNDIHQVRRGMWEAYTGDDSPPTANECPCAIERFKQHLCCGVKLLWQGSAGIAEDKWTFDPEYYYSMANIIDDSPGKPWRSETDNAACNIVIDTGANVRVLIDGVAFFGCNVRTLSFQMNAADAWGGPSVDESVSFDLTTGTVDAVAGRNIQDTSLLANYKDHALKGYYLRATSGTDSGLTWKILDNVGTWIVLDTESSHNVAAGSPADTFVIFQPWIAYTFTNTTPYRYIRISIGAQHTAEDYYQIGMAVMGKAITLSRAYHINFRKSNVYDVKMLRTISGGLNVIKNADRKRKFELEWKDSEDTYNEVIATVDHLDGKNLCLIPDSSALTDCYLVKSIGDIVAEHVKSDEYNFNLDLEEIL